MNRPDAAGAPSAARHAPPQRLLHVRRRLRAGVVQLLCAAVGLGLGLTLPRVSGGPTVDSGRLSELLFTLGTGVIGLVSIVFALLFGVVQWSASTFSPRLTLFRGDPLVWRTYAFTIGMFVFSTTAGLVSGRAGRVSLVVPITAVLAALIALALIRALQIRAFLSLQLAQVLDAVVARGRAVIGDLYTPRSAAGEPTPAAAPLPALRRSVSWAGAPGVVQQLELRRLVNAATQADAVVVFRVGVGDTLHEAAPLADLLGGDLPDRVVRAAVIRGAERSFDQDPMLAVRLLADIGLRALSPAVNDPATAVDAIDATESLLRALAGRQLDIVDIADRSGVPRVRLVLPTWEDYLRTGVEDLLLPAARIPMVLERLQRLLTNLLEMSPSPRHAPLIRLSEQVQAQLGACRPAPTQQSPREPRAPREPEQSVPKGTR
ncbi:DUF2254 family protein [Modestobacter marinus]|uniref:DUF2254 family protein n=1 Tax=Modestobacter marinus TaxID=477641 RepID=UPI001C974A50|nr:DUF2254 family protein [Modestobacter marinus]